VLHWTHSSVRGRQDGMVVWLAKGQQDGHPVGTAVGDSDGKQLERPESRKAEKPKGGNPGSRGAGKAEKPNRLRSGRSDETSCALTLNYWYAT
jgi:hypothetical protein